MIKAHFILIKIFFIIFFHPLQLQLCSNAFHWMITVQAAFSLAGTESTGLNNPVLSKSTESLDNVQLTICTPVL